MKHIIKIVSVVFITTLMLGTIPANAQGKRNVGKEAKNLFFGPKVGLNYSTLTEADDASRTGLVIGAFGEYKYRADLSFSAELLYSQQGAIEEFEGNDIGFHLDYLNIPIMVNYYLFDGLSIKIGLQPGFLLSSEVKVGGLSVDAKDDCNSIDFAIPIGVSYSFDLGLKLDVRYNIGLTEIANKDETDAKLGSNSVFQFTIGWTF